MAIRIVKLFIFILLIILPVLYLVFNMMHVTESPTIIMISLLFLSLLIIGVINIPLVKFYDSSKFNELVIGSLLVTIGSLFTYFVANLLDFGSVVPAALCGVIAGLVPLLFRKLAIADTLSEALYIGAFVGMTSIVLIKHPVTVLIAGIVAGLLFGLSKNIFNGFGGKLGTIAFGGVLMALIFQNFL